MKPKSDPLSIALEELRDRPIVAESRDFARHWERSRARSNPLRRVVFGPAGGAIAAVCLMICVVFILQPMAALPSLQKLISRNLIETGIGETRVVTLDDGSRIMLDTGSRARVVFKEATRDVELLEGQAHFEVAKDAHRPFRVRTKFAEVVAVGTMFDVAALSALTTVTLIEGRVNVRTLSDVSQVEPQVEALTPGQQLGVTSNGKFLGKKTVKIASVTAWQRGTIVLDDVPLPKALAALNRYSRTQIVIQDTQLQSRSVSGVFRLGDVETEALVLQRYFGLREHSRSDREIVLRLTEDRSQIGAPAPPSARSHPAESP
jgi:transmembrane sensor